MVQTNQKHLVEVAGNFQNGEITTELSFDELRKLVLDDIKITIVKNAIPAEMAAQLRDAVWAWNQKTPLSEADDFVSNKHRHRCLVSKIQQSPYLFHDHTFDNFADLDDEFRAIMVGVYEPLRKFWNNLTQHNLEFAQHPVPKGTPYFHPQITHYPVGGSFFGRHWHALAPQYVGIILSLSEYGVDYSSGSNTNFEIDGEIVKTEGHHNIGDMTLFRYDVPHWISHSDAAEKFDWYSKRGRWVAILPLYDPWAEPDPYMVKGPAAIANK